MVGSVLSYFRRSWKFLVVTAGATIALSAIAVVVSLSGINFHRFEFVFSLDALTPAVSGGWNFDPVFSPRVFGPKATQLYGHTAIGGMLGIDLSLGQAALSGRKNACQ